MTEKELIKLKKFLQGELLDVEETIRDNQGHQLIRIELYRQANLKLLLDLVLKKLKE